MSPAKPMASYLLEGWCSTRRCGDIVGGGVLTRCCSRIARCTGICVARFTLKMQRGLGFGVEVVGWACTAGESRRGSDSCRRFRHTPEQRVAAQKASYTLFGRESEMDKPAAATMRRLLQDAILASRLSSAAALIGTEADGGRRVAAAQCFIHPFWPRD